MIVDLGISHGQKVETIILLKKDDYFIASMPSHNNDLLVVSAASYNTVKDPTPDLEPGTSVACMVVTDLGFGELVVQARDAFREKLSEDDADRIRAFFGSVRAGRLYNEAVSRDAIPQRTDVQLNNSLRGSVFRVRVTRLFGTRAQVTLLGVQVSGYYHAYIQRMDMNERDVKEGESLVAKYALNTLIIGRIIAVIQTERATSEPLFLLYLSMNEDDLALPEVLLDDGIDSRENGYLVSKSVISPWERKYLV